MYRLGSEEAEAGARESLRRAFLLFPGARQEAETDPDLTDFVEDERPTLGLVVRLE